MLRLEKIFEEIDKTPRAKTCDAIMGIIEEGKEIMKEFKGAPASTPGSSQPRRQSNTMKSPATALSRPGRLSLA